MEPDSPEPATTPSVATVAAAWVARRDAGLTPGERAALEAWLAAAPAHAAAFAAADRDRNELDWALHAGATDEVLAGLALRDRQRRRRRHAAGAAAALLLLVAGWFARPHFGPPPLPSPAAGPLVVHEPPRETLPDGTIVELKDSAAIRVSFDDRTRLVHLLHGTAHFRVARSERPFIVRAGQVDARALGTVFVVEFEDQHVSVIVTEGVVAVSPEPVPAALPPAVAVLDAGKTVRMASGAEASAPEITALDAAALDTRLAWRAPRLEFNGTPLSEVVAKVNQHNRRQIELADPSLRSFALSGVLRADKLDALIAMLEEELPVKIEADADRIVVRRAP